MFTALESIEVIFPITLFIVYTMIEDISFFIGLNQIITNFVGASFYTGICVINQRNFNDLLENLFS
jgi:hypothetical protein